MSRPLRWLPLLGGLLFGYDTAVISGAEQAIEVYLIDSLDLGSFAHGITVYFRLDRLYYRRNHLGVLFKPNR